MHLHRTSKNRITAQNVVRNNRITRSSCYNQTFGWFSYELIRWLFRQTRLVVCWVPWQRECIFTSFNKLRSGNQGSGGQPKSLFGCLVFVAVLTNFACTGPDCQFYDLPLASTVLPTYRSMCIRWVVLPGIGTRDCREAPGKTNKREVRPRCATSGNRSHLTKVVVESAELRRLVKGAIHGSPWTLQLDEGWRIQRAEGSPPRRLHHRQPDWIPMWKGSRGRC